MTRNASSGPQIGWVALSRKALAAAEKLVRDDDLGVRDEVGVLAIHRGYADRFFPGTSVQHSRIRYLLFVAWQLHATLRDAEVRSSTDAREAMEKRELKLAHHLHQQGLKGVIGGQTATDEDRLTSLPASAAYWSALGAWGVLDAGPDAAPSRRDMFNSWNAWAERPSGSRLTDDEHGLLQRKQPLLGALPPVPKGWDSLSKPLDFELRNKETQHLRRLLTAVRRPTPVGSPGPTRRSGHSQSLLAHLVEARFYPTGKASTRPWHAQVLELAGNEDKAALLRARDASSLAAILRGLYNACVEAVRDEVDQIPNVTTHHREHLVKLVKRHHRAAARVDPHALLGDGLRLGGLPDALTLTKKWVANTPHDPLAARHWLAKWEQARKQDRARLPGTTPAKAHRADWTAPKARPLGYRWWVVVSMLHDLAGVR